MFYEFGESKTRLLKEQQLRKRLYRRRCRTSTSCGSTAASRGGTRTSCYDNMQLHAMYYIIM